MGTVATGAINLTKPEKFAPASKFIGEIEYDPKNETMDITFKSGSKYRYLDVSPMTFLSFKSSPTQDSYYARAIKGNIQSVKLIDQGIGREKSTPLDKVHDRRTLDQGLKKMEGTVARAYAGRQF